ncbi:thiol reductant ABC exporter subunit CydD [Ligilactobacillus pobuzihii]|uniref:Transport ATP-binding protein CydC n=1 Tax=Ligilactobacillus pobuzihii TaxID=449659 RepID=A0A0R2L246_9LACO|nr:thiol reductant ABC exporter subunit CydD [Ligilactobacillus pobuzihii]KRK09946.1 transport ATP-binding protein CydC [Ligilactobacillus pobuzihii E100301 = KCTC 13174]KRN95633.1 transport ATP-binding protein CydC [Ligilactobacillus pobuzihii]GEN47949.1 thiol reductant ABC exporter subunit CydD [Ligilactobacillus pobuzihii]
MLDKKIMELPGAKGIMSLLTLLTLIQSVAIIGQTSTISRAIVGLWNGHPLSAQITWLVWFVVLYVLRHLCIYIKQQRLDKFASKQSQEIRNQLLDKIFRVGPEITQKEGTGNVTTMALEGVDQVEDYLSLSLSKIVNMMIIPFVILIGIAVYDWKSAAFLLLILPVDVIFMIILGYAAQAKADKQYASYQILSNHFVDSLRGIDTLKFFGLSKKYGQSIFKTSEKFRIATIDTLKIAILSTFALDFFTTLSIAVVAVFLGLHLISGKILLYPALVILTLSPEYFLPIRDFSNDYHATLNGKNAFSAINEILDFDEDPPVEQTLPQWDENSHLKVEQMSYAYNQAGQKNQFSFEIDGFQKVGVIGLSGSGKSTLINLLSGFTQPKHAQIDFNGVKFDSFKQADWQKQIIYIPQDPYIFHASLHDNIVFYHQEASDEQVTKAVKVVGLEQLVKDLPDGLDTLIGEGARSLSGGQAQRIALARAFLDQSRKIILFDEPTAHLDIETEVELKERMLPLMENHLVIFATHRLHWMNEMDQILVLDNGQVVEAGSLDELQEKNGALVQLRHAMGRI